MGRSLSFYTVDVRILLRDSHIFIDKDNPNIIQNDVRPYYISIDLDSKYKAFVPIRTNLSHKYGFVTKIENDKKSGLDFTKTLIVEKSRYRNYLKNCCTISNKEYSVIARNEQLVEQKLKAFIQNIFIPIKDKEVSVRTPTETRIYEFSSLQYFEKTLDDLKFL